ncbi:MAG: tetratricopeptide repeat protein [Spirochaetes bacterium]|nr:tetratricopeptide repeat protein [Spirochaetota bacterium]
MSGIEGTVRSAASLNRKGIDLTDVGKYTEAIAAFASALEAGGRLPGILFNRAEAERLSGDFESARKDLDEALALAPTEPDYLHALGLLAYDMDNFAAADALYNQVIALKADHSQAWNDKGIIRFRKGEYAAARSCFEKAVAADPELKEGWFNLADTYDELGMKEARAEALRKLSALGARAGDEGSGE